MSVRNQLTHYELEEFFRSLQDLLVLSLNPSLSFDSAEFLSRRLDGFERTLSVLSSRLRVSAKLQNSGPLLKRVSLEWLGRAGPLNYIPSSFFKHSIRLANRRAAEPLNYIPSSFIKNSIYDWRAAEPLQIKDFKKWSCIL